MSYFHQLYHVLYLGLCLHSSLVLANIMTVVFPKTEVRLQMLYNDLPKILSKLLYAYIHPPLAGDEVSGLALQLVTANFVMKMMV